MVICGTDDLQHRYRGRIEKVKFGVPIAEAFAHDIPATLLVLLLKVNKEGPFKKDIWRAPGNAAQVRKLSHIMQHGRLVNISNISVYTAASVIKRFLAKLPGGIFGSENEQELFTVVQQPDSEQQRQVFCRVICSLSVPSQHLLVLLFGTFRIISDSAETFGTRMTPEAIGISVAPSLFHTCIHDGEKAKLEDVMRFKMASQVVSKIIQGFGYTNLFPRECYEFYARITGRTLRVDEQWHFTFQYPSTATCAAAIARSYSLDAFTECQESPMTPRSVMRYGSLKANTSTQRNRLSAPPNQIYAIKESENVSTNGFNSVLVKTPIAHKSSPAKPKPNNQQQANNHPKPCEQCETLAAFEDFDLRESASWSYSQPTIAAGSDTPPPSTSAAAAAAEDNLEELDAYGECLPGPSTSHGYSLPRKTRASSTHPLPEEEEMIKEVISQRLSSSLGEVLVHSDWEEDIGMGTRCTDSLESTRSLTYLEWVHEKQTRRMRTRSEWFLSPIMPPKNGSSMSADFRSARFSRRLTLPKHDEDSLISSSEDIAQPSSSKILPIEPILEDPQTPRQPLQPIQQPYQSNSRHSSSGGASEPATPQAVTSLSAFFGSSSISGDGHAPNLTKTDQASVAGGSVAPPKNGNGNGNGSRISNCGVVRRRSWRTHYVRPHKSFEQADLGTVENIDVGQSSRSTPIRRRSSNGNGDRETRALIRRKSSGSSTSKSKMPVQARKSTQI
uniref:Rho-GAP domain-containing protein n=1 Tax=Acrobeloides nanus TaxID=290746 RepID=A0A914DGF2_9BILA